MAESIELGRGIHRATLPLSMVNRHVLVTGATGSGKTVSLLGIAARLSEAGVPIFFPDVKGDVSTLARCVPSRILSRFRLPARDVDPVTMGRALGLTEAQAGTLEIAWMVGNGRVATGSAFSTLDDVRSLLAEMQRAPRAFAALGNVSPASVGVLQRAFLAFTRHGGADLLGDPGFDVARLIDLATDGRGIVSILPAERLATSGALYALALVYILDQIFARFPEVGDLDKPRVVLIFDESHLIFQDATPEAVRDFARKVRLLRSKGVGLIFASQSPGDIPPEILSHCGTRIQHGLRAASPIDLRALKVAAETLPARAGVDMVAAIKALGTGSAIVSVIDTKGVPSTPVRVAMVPPPCKLGALSTDEAASLGLDIAAEPVKAELAPVRTLDFFVGLGTIIFALGVLIGAAKYAIG